MRESEDLIESARKVAEERLYKCQKAKMKDWSSMKRRTQRFTGLHLSTNEAKSGDSTDIHGGLI